MTYADDDVRRVFILSPYREKFYDTWNIDESTVECLHKLYSESYFAWE